MLEYSLDEAQELLTSKSSAATTNLKSIEEDLEFLREQITTMEVSTSFMLMSDTARVHNWDVKQRRLQ